VNAVAVGISIFSAVYFTYVGFTVASVADKEWQKFSCRENACGCTTTTASIGLTRVWWRRSSTFTWPAYSRHAQFPSTGCGTSAPRSCRLPPPGTDFIDPRRNGREASGLRGPKIGIYRWL